MTQQESIIVYTDGGCKGNPGPGGWAYVMRFGDRYRECKGADAATTNNKMELSAVIEALSFLNDRIDAVHHRRAGSAALGSPWTDAPIVVFTDSLYVKNGITSWIHDWKKRGWKTAAKKPVMNQELWQRLDLLCQKLTPRFEWVEGHAGNADNERCDELVGLAVAELKNSGGSPALTEAN